MILEVRVNCLANVLPALTMSMADAPFEIYSQVIKVNNSVLRPSPKLPNEY